MCKFEETNGTRADELYGNPFDPLEVEAFTIHFGYNTFGGIVLQADQPRESHGSNPSY